MKLSQDGEERPFRSQNQQIKVYLRRRFPEPVEAAYNALLQRMKGHAPSYPKLKRACQQNDTPHMLMVSMPDAHFGMYAWAKETGEDYDTRIAERLYCTAGQTLLDSALSTRKPIECIVLPVGSDFFHANDPTNQTPKSGNRLDVDTRLAKVFEVGQMAVVRLIDLCLEVAPVHVIWVRGNHDPQSSWFMAKTIEAWYRLCPDVSFDVEPKPQKHVVFGKTLIGLTHGDEENPRDLVGIMASKWKPQWSATDYHEWHCGHYHKKKEVYVVTGDTYAGGVWIRYLPSLCSKDFWHVTKGYMSVRAAEAFLYHHDYGMTNHFSTNIHEITEGSANE